MASYICPYCFTENPMNSVHFRCGNRNCPPELDKKLALYETGSENANLLMGKVIIPPNKKFPGILSGMPTEADCPSCKEKTYKRICPQCHNELPREIDRHKGIIISVVGAKNTGKSHFIAVLIDQMRRYISGSINASFAPINTDHQNRYKKDFYNPLYDSHRLLDATASGINTYSTARKPLIYALTINNQGRFANNTIIYITFFDTAGEDLSDEDTMSTVNKYIARSSGVIFLLDPIQIQDVRDRIDPNIVTASSATDIRDLADPSDILRRVTNLIRDANNIADNKKISVPIAAAFTKLDTLDPILPLGSTVKQTSPHRSCNGFNIRDCDNVNLEIDAMLSEWGGWDFPQQLRINYQNYNFFGLSALGKIPEGKMVESIRPHRIEDPLLWLLSYHGIIPIIRNR